MKKSMLLCDWSLEKRFKTPLNGNHCFVFQAIKKSNHDSVSLKDNPKFQEFQKKL